MNLTSHRTLSLTPRVRGQRLRDARLVVIAAEDTYAAKQYFESDLFQSNRIKIEVLATPNTNDAEGEITNSSPLAVANRLHAYIEKYDLNDDDILCIMVDKDRWPDRMLSEVARKTFRRKRRNILLAVSNPCFELWLYLHVSDWDTSISRISSQEMTSKLRDALGGSYNKTNLNMNDYDGRIIVASDRARQLDTSPGDRWAQSIGTRVYRLIEELQQAGLFQE